MRPPIRSSLLDDHARQYLILTTDLPEGYVLATVLWDSALSRLTIPHRSS